MDTNNKIHDIIMDHADLLVGNKKPTVLLDFAEHVASLKIMILKWKDIVDGDVVSKDWKAHLPLRPHPTDFNHYVRASFEILKAEQSAVLNGEKKYVNENDLEIKINLRMIQLKNEWEKEEDIERKKLST